MKILIPISFAIILASCSESRERFSQLENEQSDKSTIYVVRPDEDRPLDAKIRKLTVKLKSPGRMRSMSDSATLIDEKTDYKYNIPYFREILGVRSSNEEAYILKLYEDNKLYGLTPIYTTAGTAKRATLPDDIIMSGRTGTLQLTNNKSNPIKTKSANKSQ